MTRSERSLGPARRRTVRVLVAGVGLGSTGHIAAITVATIVAGQLAGSSAWAGAPGAAIVLGSATGSAVLAALMVRRGRRAGLAAGYAIGVLGALLAAAAVTLLSLPLLLAGTALIGFGNSANQLSRYAAADLYPPERRASAIGTVVWGATIGAVVGPNLVESAGGLAIAIGLPVLAGAYLVPIAFVGGAAILSFVALRPDPYELADPDALRRDDDPAPVPIAALLRRPTVLAAIVALVTGQAVMVLIMTMTPLHMTDHGHGLGAVGLVISGHTFGMFALSPLSGRLTDRFGSPLVIAAGLTVLAGAALLAAAAPPDGGVLLFIALFLLGYGWNLGFVAGSTMLAGDLAIGERTRLEGATDALIWSSAAGASLSSGLVVAGAGYATLGLVGAALVLLPGAALLGARRRPAPRPTT